MTSVRYEPDTRPLGYIALGLAGLTGLLALSYLLGPLALLSGPLEMLAGGAARTVPDSRRPENAALVVAPVAMALAVVVVVAYG